MKKKMAIFGGSFNPVHDDHIAIVENLIAMDVFQRILVYPCGTRPEPEKRFIGDVESFHRAAIIDIAFNDLDVEVILDDIEDDKFTRTHELEEIYGKDAEVWHVIGSDWIVGGAKGESRIQKEWVQGEELWKKSNFFLVKRKGYIITKADLPPNCVVLDFRLSESSTNIRQRIYTGKSIEGYVPANVKEYINRYNLYRGTYPLSKSNIVFSKPRVLFFVDDYNEEAKRFYRDLRQFEDKKNPQYIVSIGGDGTQLRAFKKYWRMRIPFLGINMGSRGYLLNDFDPELLFQIDVPLAVYNMQLLQVDVKVSKRKAERVLAHNDAWVERQTGQTAKFLMQINDRHIPEIEGDQILISTAAGSTGYAVNVTGFSLPPYMSELYLVGQAIKKPIQWKNSLLSSDSVIKIESLDTHKRPVKGCIDGQDLNNVEWVEIRKSRIAAVEIAFDAKLDIVAKHNVLQMPYLLEM